MSDDIVDRLHHLPICGMDICHCDQVEAADEIVRLRTRVAELEAVAERLAEEVRYRDPNDSTLIDYDNALHPRATPTEDQ